MSTDCLQKTLRLSKMYVRMIGKQTQLVTILHCVIACSSQKYASAIASASLYRVLLTLLTAHVGFQPFTRFYWSELKLIAVDMNEH